MRTSTRQILCCLFLIAALLTPDGATAKRRKTKRTLKCHECTHQMTSGEGVWVRNPKRAYGLEPTIRQFLKAVGHVRTKFPGTPDLMVGDISRLKGGKMRPHRSHRDGRDIDAGFYFRDGRARKYFAKPRRKTLDVPRTWALFDALVATGNVQFIFVSYRIQRALYRHAQKLGVPKKKLKRLFQWPRHWRRRAGIIRFERGHDDHFHVRFRGDVEDKKQTKSNEG